MATIGMYLMMVRLGTTPLMVARAAKTTRCKKVMASLFGLGLGAAVPAAIAASSTGSIQTTNVMTTEGTSIGLSAGVTASIYGANIVSGVGMMGYGIYNLWAATRHKKVGEAACKVFDTNKLTSTP